jgi:hypothetical protein
MATFTFMWQMIYGQSAIDKVTGNFSSDLVYSVRGRATSGKYENIKKGTPYFINKWLPATVVLFNGKQFDNVMAKMDLLEHKLLYMENGVEYTAESPIKEVVLNDSGRGTKYRFIHASAFPNPVQKNDNGWYLVLANGEVSVYKFISKKIEESRQYSSAIIDRNIENSDKYFISHKNVLVPVKRLKDITDILRSRRSELNDYINKQGWNKVSDESLERLIAYYNSLGN